ncbi:MAG: class I SAM-dependent methyltransferase [Butyricicoccus sp.]
MEIMKENNTPNHPSGLLVFAASEAEREAAELLAKRLNAEITQEKPDADHTGLVLQLDADGLCLVGGGLVLRGDFTRMLPRLKPANLQRELLVRASKRKNAGSTPTAVDATAGLGEDALLLAAAGFSVKLYEYDPVIAALLRDALRRAAELPELTDIVGRMELFEADSLTALPQLSAAPDVILLDPMFPARQKSALIKKKFQLLQQLERPCADETELMNAAIAAHPRKIVIKRPLKGPYLAGRKPSYSLTGKAIRYDCLVLP